MKLDYNDWQRLLIIADAYGFQPSPLSWKLAAGAASCSGGATEAHFWWHFHVYRVFSGFDVFDQTLFKEALERYLLDRGVSLGSKADPYRNPASGYWLQEIAKNPVCELVDTILHFLGEKAWSWNLGGGVNLVLEPPLQQPKVFQIDAAEGDEDIDFFTSLTNEFEIRRLGLDALDRGHFKPDRFMDLHYVTWRSVLEVSHIYAFSPKAPDWQKWMLYYAFRNPTEPHDLVSDGYIRIHQFGEDDKTRWISGLNRVLADNFAAKERTSKLKWEPYTALMFSATSNVNLSLLSHIIDFSPNAWKIYNDGVVRLYKKA